MNGVFQINNLTFFYPEQSEPAIRGLSLTVERGEFLVLCGPSGCGKTTLLRQFKSVIAPHGRKTGEILFAGRPLDTLDQREQTERIGFVQQFPENQIVTDKVWHELAFGMESLGYDTPTIRRRVAEMASFFGIQTWFYKNVTVISGGMALVWFLQFMGITDLTNLIGQEGMTTPAESQLKQYAAFLADLFIFAICISRKEYRPDYLVQIPKEKRKLSKRTIIATVLILLLIPLTLFIGETYFAGKNATLLRCWCFLSVWFLSNRNIFGNQLVPLCSRLPPVDFSLDICTFSL